MTPAPHADAAALADATANASVRAIAPPAAAIGLLILLLYGLPLVFDLPLIDPDEGLHAAISLDMVERGDYAVPRMLGEPFLDKPIAFFFAQAVSLRVFGATEFAVRLPGQVFGLLGALTAGLVAGALAGRRAAAVTGCVYATLAFPMLLNQAAVHDVALVPWTNLALFCFLKAFDRRGDSRATLAWCGGAGVWLGLAMLTKGLAGVALVGLPVAVLTIWRRHLWWGLAAGAAVSLAVAALIAAPWYLALERAEPGYLRYFFVQRHLLGFTTTTQLHGQRPWFYYLPIVMAGSVPWVMTLPLALRSAAVLPGALASLRRTAATWLAVDVAFLSAAGSKLATYVLPVFPAVAALVAVGWLGTPTSDGGRPVRRMARLLTAQGVAAAALLPVAAVWSHWIAGVPVGVPAAVVTAAVATAWAVLAWTAGRRSLRWSFCAMAAGVALTLIAGYVAIFPAAARAHSARDLATYLNDRGVLPPRLWIVDERVGSVLFYLDRGLRHEVRRDTLEGVPLGRALVQGGGVAGTLIAVPEDVVARLAARIEVDAVPFEPAGRYRVYDAQALRAARPRR